MVNRNMVKGHKEVKRVRSSTGGALHNVCAWQKPDLVESQRRRRAFGPRDRVVSDPLFQRCAVPRRNILGPFRPDMLLSKIDGRDRRTLFQFERTQGTFVGFNWSKDGEWLAFTRGTGPTNASALAHLWKLRSDGADLQHRTPHQPGHNGSPSFGACVGHC
jgi:hypothetical protein